MTQLEAERFSSVWEFASSVLMMFFAASLTAFPFYVCGLTHRVSKSIKEKDKEKFDEFKEIFPSIRMKDTTAIQHNLVFILRRYAMIAVLVISTNNRL